MQALALLGGAAISLLLAPGPATPAQEQPQRSNGRIAFVAPTGIASMNPDGSGLWAVELNVGDHDPAWSPDGSRLAVVTHWGGRDGILVMHPDGSNAALVVDDPNAARPAWSPDGTRIAFESAGDVVVVRADGTGRTALTRSPEWDGQPTWSPDGRRLAYASHRNGDADLFVRDLATGADTRLPTGPRDEVDPAWSPDGSEIAFTRREPDGAANLFAFQVAASGERRLTAARTWSSRPAWAPDGTRVAFERDGRIWVVPREGGPERALTSGCCAAMPAWQPVLPAPARCTIPGTAANDLLVGSPGPDVVCGLDGDDTVLGLDGDDVLLGGPGRDWVAGGQGADYLDGGAGPDALDARDGRADVVLGGPGRDVALLERYDTRVWVEVGRTDGNLAAWRPVTASNAMPTNPPVLAVDGRPRTWWNSGGYAPQWLEVDLQRVTDVGRLRLVAGPQPRGTVHLILGKGPGTGGAYRLLATVRGPTAAFQALVVRPARPWRRIRTLRIATPDTVPGAQWVSWHELEAYAPATARR